MSKRKSLQGVQLGAKPCKLPRPYEIYKDSQEILAKPESINHCPQAVPEVQHHIVNGDPSGTPSVQYPTNLYTFADGIQSDLYDILSTGARLLYTFGSSGSSNSSSVRKHKDDANDIADFANGGKGTLAPKPNGYSSDIVHKPLPQMTKSELGMRCPSALSEKENKSITSVPSIPKTSRTERVAQGKINKGCSLANNVNILKSSVGTNPIGSEITSIDKPPVNNLKPTKFSKSQSGEGQSKYSGGMKIGDHILQSKLVGNAKLPVSD